MSDLDACAGIVERGDPDRFAAVMAAPVGVRPVLWPIYAFNVEVGRAPWLTREPLIAEMRLQWWRDVLEEIAAGGPVRRHEVATPLAAAVGPHGAALLRPAVDARLWDVHETGFEDDAALWAHLDAVAGTLLRAAAQALGATIPAVMPAESGEASGAAALGRAARAQGLANWLRAVPALEAAGKRPLPDGRPEAVARLALTGLSMLEAARRDGVPPEAGPAMLALSETRPMLRRAAARPGLVARGELGRTPLARSVRLMMLGASGRF